MLRTVVLASFMVVPLSAFSLIPGGGLADEPGTTTIRIHEVTGEAEIQHEQTWVALEAISQDDPRLAGAVTYEQMLADIKPVAPADIGTSMVHQAQYYGQPLYGGYANPCGQTFAYDPCANPCVQTFNNPCAAAIPQPYYQIPANPYVYGVPPAVYARPARPYYVRPYAVQRARPYVIYRYPRNIRRW